MLSLEAVFHVTFVRKSYVQRTCELSSAEFRVAVKADKRAWFSAHLQAVAVGGGSSRVL